MQNFPWFISKTTRSRKIILCEQCVSAYAGRMRYLSKVSMWYLSKVSVAECVKSQYVSMYAVFAKNMCKVSMSKISMRYLSKVSVAICVKSHLMWAMWAACGP